MPRNASASHKFNSALEAIRNLCEEEFFKLDSTAGKIGLPAHSDIKRVDISQKSAVFFKHYVPLRAQMVDLLADNYRRFFKLALAHPSQTGVDPDRWAWSELRPALDAAFAWMHEWYILACEGENQSIRNLAWIPVLQPGTISFSIPTAILEPPSASSWRAPAWLFGISLAYFGVGPLKQNHVPEMDSEERLGQTHTRLLLKGARRTLLWDLEAKCERLRNEEIVAAGVNPAEMLREQGDAPNQLKGSKSHLKGTEGLGPKKTDLSQYMQDLTEKQRLAFSLKYEYELGLAEIASRMELDRKTVYEHIEAAKRKIDQTRSSERRKAHRTDNRWE